MFFLVGICKKYITARGEIMNKYRIYLVFIVYFFVFPVCSHAFLNVFGDNSVDLVKNTVLSFDKSVTVQEALEGHQLLKNQKWQSIEDSQKRKYVIFTADIDTPSLRNHLKRLKIWTSLSELLSATTIPINLEIQFTINKDGTSFPNFLKFYTPIDSIFSPKTLDDVLAVMKVLYQNDFPELLISSIFITLDYGLIYAVEKEDLDMTLKYLEYGFDPDRKMDRGNLGPAIEKAMHTNNLEIISALLKYEADASYLLRSSNIEVIKIAVESGADVNSIVKYTDDETVLMRSIAQKEIDITKYLLENNANVNFKNKSGGTALDVAVYSLQPNIIDLLFKYGANINKNRYIEHAIRSENFETIKILLENGCEISDKDILDSIWKKDFDIVKLLLENGANVNANTSENSSALMLAIERRSFEIFQLLIDNGADINFKTTTNQTPLSVAIRYGNERMVEVLLKKGVDVTNVDNLHSASSAIGKLLNQYIEKKKPVPTPQETAKSKVSQHELVKANKVLAQPRHAPLTPNPPQPQSKDKHTDFSDMDDVEPPDCESKDVVKLLLKKMAEGEIPKGQLFDVVAIRSETLYSSMCGARLILHDGSEAGFSYLVMKSGDEQLSLELGKINIKSEKYKLPLLTSQEKYIGYVKDFSESRMRFGELVDKDGKEIVFIGELAPYIFDEKTLNCLNNAIENSKLVEIKGVPVIWSNGEKMLKTEMPITCSVITPENHYTAFGLKEDVMNFVGLEKDIKKCGSSIPIDELECLKFNLSNEDLYLSKYKSSYSPGPNLGKTLVKYELGIKDNIFYASSPIPQQYAPRVITGLFKGMDDSEQYFTLTVKGGEDFFLVCNETFCQDMLKYVGKQMEVESKTIYFYDEGGESYGINNYITKFKMISE